MIKKIFIFSFIATCILQGFMFAKLGMADSGVWAKQAEYVQSGNPAQFDFLLAYGHPGGPIIEAVIFLHSIFGLSYENSLITFIIVLDGLAIAGASTICYILGKNNLWWPIVLVALSSNWLYLYSTPPSIVVSLLISFLCLFSLYIYEKEKIKPHLLVFWSMLAGLVISTRIDVGMVMAISFLIFLKPKISWQRTFLMLFGVGASFILFDPFMWFMPVRHIGDLLFKIIYLYEYFAPAKMSFSYVLSISAFSLISAFFSIVFLFLKEKIKSPLPFRLIYILLVATTVLYAIFLTAQYQAPRYFLPTTNIWQIFLPLFIFSLTSNLRLVYSKIADVFFAVILILFPLSFLVNFLLIDTFI